MISLADVQRAKADIAPYVKRTILEKNTTLSSQLGANVYLKLGSPRPIRPDPETTAANHLSLGRGCARLEP